MILVTRTITRNSNHNSRTVGSIGSSTSSSSTTTTEWIPRPGSESDNDDGETNDNSNGNSNTAVARILIQLIATATNMTPIHTEHLYPLPHASTTSTRSVIILVLVPPFRSLWTVPGETNFVPRLEVWSFLSWNPNDSSKGRSPSSSPPCVCPHLTVLFFVPSLNCRQMMGNGGADALGGGHTHPHRFTRVRIWLFSTIELLLLRI